MNNSHFTCSISERPVSEIEADFEKSTVHGADLRFHGAVRDEEEGRKISGIEYSQYEKMALTELEKIGAAMASEYPDHFARIHHVVGFVAAGDDSIIIRVQTKHSAPGFEISREYLARIKQTVPIWKKPILSLS